MDNFGKVEQKREDYQNRFSGVIGSEYNLFEKSVPWHEEFQNTIGDKISDYCLYDIIDLIYRPYDNALTGGDFIFVKNSSQLKEYKGYA